MKKIIVGVLGVFLFCFEGVAQQNKVTYLDSLEFGEIVNLYGPPNKNQSFGREDLKINETIFERGLGTHAPAELHIDLNGKAETFSAEVGIDNEVTKLWNEEARATIKEFPQYVYDNRVDHYDDRAGGTVVFRVLIDGKVAFESDVMKHDDPPVSVEVDLSGAEKLTLIGDATNDGSYADHINWANAKIIWNSKPDDDVKIYNHPDDILVNHIGFVPESFKTCYLWGREKTNFSIKSNRNDNTVYTGEMIPESGDLGDYLVGDFSDFTIPGSYYIESGNRKSEVFEIADDVYLKALKANINYINQQRSGDPDAGWTKGEHLDDGIRQDNGEYQDVTGGWYDASDIRKPMSGNTLLLMALINIAENNFPEFDKTELLDEMKWGNKFLFAMQEPEGYVMSYIGSTKEGLMDNRWTDNIPKTDDDRTILTNPADASYQMLFAMSNAKIARIYKTEMPDYAQKCLEAAAKAWNWTRKFQKISDPDEYGIAIAAAVALHNATQKKEFFDQAAALTKQLLSMQKEGDEYMGNHFFTFTEKAKTYDGRWVMIGLQAFTENYPKDDLAKEAKNEMNEFAHDYFMPLCRLNSFSLIPWIFATESLGSGKKYGPYHYRNFLHVGMNQHVSSKGSALTAAYKVTSKNEYL
ncbi:MAG: NPCBM/NEW2 domain-containing protein, partial [Prolixibacteraceae bacterium]